jgi:hypothetical protein
MTKHETELKRDRKGLKFDTHFNKDLLDCRSKYCPDLSRLHTGSRYS